MIYYESYRENLNHMSLFMQTDIDQTIISAIDNIYNIYSTDDGF